MQATYYQQHTQLLAKINDFVQEQQHEYASLSFEEQRHRGPCTLDYLLHQVMKFLQDDLNDTNLEDVHASSTTIPFAIRDVPALADVAALQMRLTSTVLSAISTHSIITVFDLEEWVCATEGVDHFIELGLGVGLQVLPVVQQYFQLRANSVVFPVRTRDVISFLMNDPDAREVLLYGGGDARDLLNRFSYFYERTILTERWKSSNIAHTLFHRAGQHGRNCGGGPHRVQNVRQLGVHIQDYTSFLAHLAQALAHNDEALNLSAATAAAATSRICRFERNRPLYERMIQSFDAACAERELIETMRRAREMAKAGASTEDEQQKIEKADDVKHYNTLPSSASARFCDFSVSCTESEARRYTVPLTMWCNASLVDKAKGGVDLRFHVGADNNQFSHDAGNSRITSEAVQEEVNSIAAAVVPCHGAISLPPPPVIAAGPRRRRGAVVTDVVACAPAEMPLISPAIGASSQSEASMLISAPSAGNSFVSNLLKPVSSLGWASTVLSTGVSSEAVSDAKVAAAQTEAAEVQQRSDANEAAVSEPTPLEELHAYVFEANSTNFALSLPTEEQIIKHVDRGTQLLERLRAGDRVSVKLICDIWESMQCLCRLLRGSCPSTSLRHTGEGVLSKWLTQWKQRHFIPLFSSSSGGSASNKATPSSMGRLAALRQQLGRSNKDINGVERSDISFSTVSLVDVKEILHMASPAEVCWDAWQPMPPPTSLTSSLSCACLERHYPPQYQTVLCDFFQVRRMPTLAAWHTSAQCARRVYSPALLTTDFTQHYLGSFVCCVEADVEARLSELTTSNDQERDTSGRTTHASKRCLAEERKKAETALQAALDGLSDALQVSPLRAGLFPCDYAWRCGLDGLLYAPPRFCGYNGVLLTPAEGKDNRGHVPPLHVLSFTTTEPSWAVGAVLHHLGVRSLEELVETRVSFHSTIQTQVSGTLHDIIVAIVPYVQGFCRSRFPHWYALAYPLLQQRLNHLKVVLTAADASLAPRQLLRLHWDGHLYTYAREIRLEYVAAHNIIFGTAEDYAVPMLTDALLPLFSPITLKGEEDRATLRRVLAALLGAVSSLQGSYEAWDAAETQRQLQAQAEEVLARVAVEYHFEPYRLHEMPRQEAASGGRQNACTTTSTSNAVTVEAPFTLPPRPFVRYQSFFPPGADALRQPRGPVSADGREHAQQPYHHHHHLQTKQQGPPSLHKLSRAEVAELKNAQRGSVCQNPLQLRVCAGGRLRVTLSLPGSGGTTAVVTSHPAWMSFPMSVNVNRVVATCADAVNRQRQCLKDASSNADDDVEKNSVGNGESASNDGGYEEFLTFQYHRRNPKNNVKALSSRKRMHSDTSSDHADKSNTKTSWWLLRPPASSAVVGSTADTPDYAVAAERYVYEQLCSEYAAQMQQNGVRVVWVNEHTEAGSPFDILIIRPRTSNAKAVDSLSPSLREKCGGDHGREQPSGNTDDWEVVAYVEVKSTCTANRQEFELSLSELLFAARFGATYKVYRVFGASTDKLRRMRCTVYTDLVQMWYRAELTITSEIRVTPSR